MPAKPTAISLASLYIVKKHKHMRRVIAFRHILENRISPIEIRFSSALQHYPWKCNAGPTGQKTSKSMHALATAE